MGMDLVPVKASVFDGFNESHDGMQVCMCVRLFSRPQTGLVCGSLIFCS